MAFRHGRDGGARWRRLGRGRQEGRGLTQTQTQIVAQAAVGSGIIVGPAALVHFLVKQLETQHRSGSTSDEYLLRETETTPNLSGQFLFAMSKKTAFTTSTVNMVA